VLAQFVEHSRSFLHTARARFALLGASLFWATAAVLRVLIVAWAPVVLATRSSGEIAELTLFLAIGVIAGAALVPRMIPLEALYRARWASYAIGALVLLFALVDSVWPARLMLLAIGVAGGIFIVPLNAALQHIGHETIGSGHAVAIQNFAQNLAMLAAVGVYTAAAGVGVTPLAAIGGLGVTVLVLSALLSRRSGGVAGVL
jgi:LPLT family lysophospholipid transporter-like MFS transporter